MSNLGMRPLQWACYKGMSGKWGALQFNLQPPHYFRGKEKDFVGDEALDQDGKIVEGSDWSLREGAIFVEVAPTTGSNIYDWKKKITFALSVTDMGKILLFLTTGTKTAIMHDPGAKTDRQGAIKKYLNLESPKGLVEGGALLSLSQQGGEGGDLRHTVPLTPDECLVLRSLLATAIPRALNWD